jgi:hypothetical protein
MYVIHIHIRICRISTPSLFYSGHLEWVHVMRNAYIYIYIYIYLYIYTYITRNAFDARNSVSMCTCSKMLRILRVGLRVEAHYKGVV